MRLGAFAMVSVALCSLATDAAFSDTLLLAQNTAPEKPSDIQLQTSISQASPLTAHSLIVVHVNQGEVTLEGSAMSPLARREATRLAETVVGVKGIRNRLSVVNTQTAEAPPDK